SRPTGARVALLRSPILPTAGRTIPRRGHTVQRRITRGGNRSSARSDTALTADISTVAEMRTFLLSPDSSPPIPLPRVEGREKLTGAPGPDCWTQERIRMDGPDPYAAPRVVADPAACFFYHTVELPGHGVQAGEWDLRRGVDAYLGHVPLSGRRVLE